MYSCLFNFFPLDTLYGSRKNPCSPHKRHWNLRSSPRAKHLKKCLKLNNWNFQRGWGSWNKYLLFGKYKYFWNFMSFKLICLIFSQQCLLKALIMMACTCTFFWTCLRVSQHPASPARKLTNYAICLSFLNPIIEVKCIVQATHHIHSVA